MNDKTTTNAGIVWSASGGTIDEHGLYIAGVVAGNFEIHGVRTATGEVAISPVTVQVAPSGLRLAALW